MKRRSLIDSLSQIRRSMTFGEADKKRSAFGKKSGAPGSAVERPLLDISFSSDDMKRHSYHGSSSYDHSTRESSIDAEVVGLISGIFLFLRDEFVTANRCFTFYIQHILA